MWYARNADAGESVQEYVVVLNAAMRLRRMRGRETEAAGRRRLQNTHQHVGLLAGITESEPLTDGMC